MNVIACLVAATLLSGSGTGVVDIRSVSPQDYPQVSVVVRVLDAHGRPVSGLDHDDFRVTEDGKPVSDFEVHPSFLDSGSVAVVLLLDTSYSMRGAPLEGAQAATQGFLDRLGPADRAALITFGRPPVQVSGFGPPGSITGLGGLKASGYTALYDAINLGVAQLASQTATARAVVVFSDGGDDGSNMSLAGLRQVLTDASIPVDVVGFESPAFDPTAMQDLAKASGGSYQQTSDPADLGALYGKIARNLLAQYLITYTSDGGPGPHRLQIQAQIPTVQAAASQDFEVIATGASPTTSSSSRGGGGIPIFPLLAVATVILVLAGATGWWFLGRRSPSSLAQQAVDGGEVSRRRLVLEGGGVSIAVGDDPIMIGRDPTAQVIIDDPLVSRYHANLQTAAGGLWVEDLGSSNGTMVNGVRIERELMHSGDVLDIGDLHLVLRGEP